MPRKTFRLVLDDRQKTLWARVLPTYAQTAFPPGGSECAQASHAALKDLGSKIGNAPGPIDIGAHQRPMLKAAVKWYFDQLSPEDVQDRDLLLASLQRRSAVNPSGASVR